MDGHADEHGAGLGMICKKPFFFHEYDLHLIDPKPYQKNRILSIIPKQDIRGCIERYKNDGAAIGDRGVRGTRLTQITNMLLSKSRVLRIRLRTQGLRGSLH